MLVLVNEHDEGETRLELDADARRRDGVTFRELAREYLVWLADVKDAKPKTLAEHRYLLAEPGTAHRRGAGRTAGHIIAALGDARIREITTRDVESLLRTVAATGASPRTVNKTRQLVCAIFNYAMRPSTYGLVSNPAAHADRRIEPDRAPLAFYSPEQIGAGTCPRRRSTTRSWRCAGWRRRGRRACRGRPSGR
jgi:hypothetical protein